MAYGSLKVDNIIFTNGGVDQTITVSGIVASTSGNLTVTGTISGGVVQGGTLVSGATVTGGTGQFTTLTGGTAGFTTVTGTTVTGITANFGSGVFTTQISGASFVGGPAQFTTVTGNTAGFTTVTGTTVTGTTANFGTGTFTTQVSGATIQGTTVSGATITGGTLTAASGTFTGNSTAAAFIPTGSTVPTNGVYLPAANSVAVATNGTGRLFVDGNGLIYAGHTSSTTSFESTILRLQVVGNSSTLSSAGLLRFSNDSFSPLFCFSKSRSTTVGTYGASLISGDSLGSIIFAGDDGIRGIRGAAIAAAVDSAPGIDSMPGRLVFSTTPSGSAAQTERLRITSAGLVGIGTSAPAAPLTVIGPNNATQAIFSGAAGTTDRGLRIATATLSGNNDIAILDAQSPGAGLFATLAFQTASTERMRITNTGRVGIGTTSPGSALEIDAAAATSPFIAKINTSEAARIDSSGRFLVGTSSAFATRLGTNAITPGFQVREGGAGSALLFNGTNSGSPATIYAVKSRGVTYGTIVQNNDNLFRISAAGDDGVQATEAARIDIAVDGTPGANDMPGRLVFSTTADGASSPTERLRIDSAGFVSLGGDTNTGFSNPSADNLAITTGGSERARIDSSGRLLVGTSSARANLFNATISAGLQLEAAGGLGVPNRFISVVNNFASGGDGGGVLALCRSKGGTLGSNTLVASGDQLGRFDFQGNDGTRFVSGAMIEAYVDGTPGANDMPGRLVFSTTADGASSPTERLRINNAGAIGLAGANFGAAGNVLTSNGNAAPPSWQSTTAFASIDALSLLSLSNLMLAFATRAAGIGTPGQPLFGIGPAVTSATPVGIGPHDYYPIDLLSGSFM